MTLETAAHGVGDLHFQWKMDDLDIPGAIGRTLTLPSVQPADQGRYSVQISDATGSVLTGSAGVVVLQPPQIVSAPTAQTVRQGATARFLVGATGTGVLNYRWFFNNAVISDANGPTLVLQNVTPAVAGFYHVSVSQITDNGPVSVKTEPVILSVLP